MYIYLFLINSTKSNNLINCFCLQYNNIKEFIWKSVCLTLVILPINTKVFTAALMLKLISLITYIPDIIHKHNSTAAQSDYNNRSKFNLTEEFIYFY